jgi:hypothetical protein
LKILKCPCYHWYLLLQEWKICLPRYFYEKNTNRISLFQLNFQYLICFRETCPCCTCGSMTQNEDYITNPLTRLRGTWHCSTACVLKYSQWGLYMHIWNLCFGRDSRLNLHTAILWLRIRWTKYMIIGFNRSLTKLMPGIMHRTQYFKFKISWDSTRFYKICHTNSKGTERFSPTNVHYQCHCSLIYILAYSHISASATYCYDSKKPIWPPPLSWHACDWWIGKI